MLTLKGSCLNLVCYAAIRPREYLGSFHVFKPRPLLDGIHYLFTTQIGENNIHSPKMSICEIEISSVAKSVLYKKGE